MVSISGYDSGARYVADKSGIRIMLKTYRQAEQTDWENLVGQGAWFNFNHFHFDLRSVRMVLVDGRKLMGVPPDDLIEIHLAGVRKDLLKKVT